MGDVCVLCHSALAVCSFVVLFPDTAITMAAFGCLYALLECSPCASKNEIEKAFRKVSVKHHPDKGGDNVLFQQIGRAKEILMNEELREVYDEGGMQAVLRVEQEGEQMAVDINEPDTEDDMTTFDWVELDPGQSVPARSEVIINISTGKRYLKVEREQGKTRKMVIQEGKVGKRRYCNAVKKCKDLHEARSNYKYIT